MSSDPGGGPSGVLLGIFGGVAAGVACHLRGGRWHPLRGSCCVLCGGAVLLFGCSAVPVPAPVVEILPGCSAGVRSICAGVPALVPSVRLLVALSGCLASVAPGAVWA